MTSRRKSIFCWLNPKLEVRKTPLIGFGIFASERIAQHERLVFYGGRILPISAEEKLGKAFQDMPVQIDVDYVIGPAARDEIEDANYFNHSCEPNAGFNGQIFLVAMRDIAADEHVAFDYAMCVSKPSIALSPYAFECKCGSPRCRKIITEHDWKNPELQKRYAGYFQWYLQEKIELMNRTRKK